MIKAKFGDSVRSKTDVAIKNEALCKILGHNICCRIAAMYELGITPAFAKSVDKRSRVLGVFGFFPIPCYCPNRVQT